LSKITSYYFNMLDVASPKVKLQIDVDSVLLSCHKRTKKARLYVNFTQMYTSINPAKQGLTLWLHKPCSTWSWCFATHMPTLFIFGYICCEISIRPVLTPFKFTIEPNSCPKMLSELRICFEGPTLEKYFSGSWRRYVRKNQIFNYWTVWCFSYLCLKSWSEKNKLWIPGIIS
jgi:hypothetical protein